MATYTIVEKGKSPLLANEKEAGEDIEVQDGDIFIVSADVADDVDFVAPSGTTASFEIRFEVPNPEGFKVTIHEDLNATIDIFDSAELPDVEIIAKDALSVDMSIGDDVILKNFEGSENGPDTITIGDRFTTTSDIKLEGGDNSLTVGNDAIMETITAKGGQNSITIGDSYSGKDIKLEGGGDNTIVIGNDADLDDIESQDGADSITIGDNLTARNIRTGNGDNTVVIGNDADLEDIETKDGADSITIGDNLAARNIKTGNGDNTVVIGNDANLDDIESQDGADSITVGDNLTAKNIKTGKANDSVSIGDAFNINALRTEDGDDIVSIGQPASFNSIDGGSGSDTINSGSTGDNFEAICFLRGTRIETDRGFEPVENIHVGTRVWTADHGLQTVRWIASSVICGHGRNAAVRIAPGVFGNARALWVSQQHRILISGYRMELYCGSHEVLVAAKHLTDIDGIDIVELPSVEYFHIMFDRHEIINSEGVASESFFPGEVGMEVMSDRAKTDLYRQFPQLRRRVADYGVSARYVAKPYEVRLLVA